MFMDVRAGGELRAPELVSRCGSSQIARGTTSNKPGGRFLGEGNPDVGRSSKNTFLFGLWRCLW